MTIREGDMVGWLWKRKLYVCLVYKFDGIDDHYCRLVTEKCLLSGGPSRSDATAYTYHTHLIPVDWANRYGDVILPKDHADEVGKQIRAFLLTKRGKAMMKRTVTASAEPDAPESGRGQLQRSDLPTKLCRGYSSWLSHSFEARIGDGGMRAWSLRQLRAENEVMANVFEDREKHGYSFKEIAIRRNLTENNARQIYHRSKQAIRILAGSYPVAMRYEVLQAEKDVA